MSEPHSFGRTEGDYREGAASHLEAMTHTPGVPEAIARKLRALAGELRDLNRPEETPPDALPTKAWIQRRDSDGLHKPHAAAFEVKAPPRHVVHVRRILLSPDDELVIRAPKDQHLAIALHIETITRSDPRLYAAGDRTPVEAKLWKVDP